MKILAVSDEESNILWSSQVKELSRGIDLIVSCGDLRRDYLEYLITMIDAPLIYVHGNHDTSEPEGGINIDGRIYAFGGMRFLGLGGSMRYREGLNMYTEQEMRSRFRRLRLKAWMQGIDILITHAPAKNWGDLPDLAHNGFETFNDIMTRYKPQIMLHGHVHRSYTRNMRDYVHTSGTKIMNVCGYRFIEVI